MAVEQYAAGAACGEAKQRAVGGPYQEKRLTRGELVGGFAEPADQCCAADGEFPPDRLLSVLPGPGREGAACEAL